MGYPRDSPRRGRVDEAYRLLVIDYRRNSLRRGQVDEVIGEKSGLFWRLAPKDTLPTLNFPYFFPILSG